MEDEPRAGGGRGSSARGGHRELDRGLLSLRALSHLPCCPQLELLVCTVSLKSDRQTVAQGSCSLEIAQLLHREETSEAQVKPGSVADAKNISPSVTINQIPQALQSGRTLSPVPSATPTLALGVSARLSALRHLLTECSVTEALGRVTRRSRQKHKTSG